MEATEFFSACGEKHFDRIYKIFRIEVFNLVFPVNPA